MIVDEGGAFSIPFPVVLGSNTTNYCITTAYRSFVAGGIETKYGAVVASPSIAEKGYMDVRLEISSPGGHSSVPPPHTVWISSSFLSSLGASHSFPFSPPLHFSVRASGSSPL